MPSVVVTGVRETAERMLSLPTRVMQRRPLREALRASGAVYQEAAAANAPVDTGRMRRGIVVRRGVSRKLYESVNVTVVRAYYWKFVEFGTSKQSAQPFMRPAFESAQAEATKKFALMFRDGVADAIGSLRK